MKLLFLFSGGKYDPELLDLVESFRIRIARYTEVETRILPERTKKKNADPLAYVESNDVVVLFDERGKLISSEDYAKLLERINISGGGRAVFIVGDAFGVDQTVRERADHTISFSKMIFPHQLARVMALEQTYRALSINAGSKYHHG